MIGQRSRGVESGDAAARGDSVPALVLRGISRNSAFLLAGQCLGSAISFVYILILARYLGVEDFGVFNLVIGFAMIASIAIEFGLGRLIVRDLARDAGLVPSYLSTLLQVRAVLALAGYVALLAVVWLIGYPERTLVLTAIAAVALFPVGLGLVFDSLFQAREQMRYSAAGTVLIALVQCLGGTAIIVGGGGLHAILAAGVVANLAYMAFLARRARECGYRFYLRFDRRLCAHLLRQAAPFALVTLSAVLASRAELLILGSLSTAENLGLFSAAAKFYEAALMLPALLVSAAAPAISRFHAGSKEHLRSVYMWALRRVLSVTLPLTLAGIVLAESILGLLFPPDYRRATYVLQLLFCAFTLASVHIMNSAVLMMSNRPRLMMLNAGISMVVQFALGLALIPRLGLIGAAVSALASQGFNLAFSHWCVRSWFVDTAGLRRYVAAPLIAGCVGGGTALVLVTPWGAFSALPVLAAYGLAYALATTLWPAPHMPQLKEKS